MKAVYYNLLTVGKIGISCDVETEINRYGLTLPICISGKLENKTRTLFKPKIPKSGKTIYKQVYIRSVKSFNYLYDIDTSIFLCSLLKDKEPKVWIDKNESEIKRKLNELK